MIVSKKGSVIILSELAFSEWSAQHNIQNEWTNQYAHEPINEDALYNKLIKEGYKVNPFLSTFSFDGNPPKEKRYIYSKPIEGNEEKYFEYQKHKHLFMFFNIAEELGFEEGMNWLEKSSLKNNYPDYFNKIKDIVNKIPRCLQQSPPQCSLFCEYYKNGCELPAAASAKELIDFYTK